MERLTHEEFLEMARAQGVPGYDIACVCPVCGTVQSFNSLVAAGASRELADKYFGFSCEGRVTGAGPWPAEPSKARASVRGCDWTLGGLFRIHQIEVITDDGKLHPHFALASKDDAAALRNSLLANGDAAA